MAAEVYPHRAHRVLQLVPAGTAKNIGKFSPVGATVEHHGVKFSVYSRNGSGVELQCFSVGRHRVVHGRTKFAGPVLVDDTVLADLESLVLLAPSIRDRVCLAMNWLGLDFDEASNAQGGPRIFR